MNRRLSSNSNQSGPVLFEMHQMQHDRKNFLGSVNKSQSRETRLRQRSTSTIHKPGKPCRQLVPMNYKRRAYRYTTADVLIVCTSFGSVGPLMQYFSRIKIRTNDPLDEGRHMHCISCNSPMEVIERVIENRERFGFILTDLFFSSEFMSGREMIRQLRQANYFGAIIYLADSGISEALEEHFMCVGADALLVKGTRTMKIEFERLIRDLVFRNIGNVDQESSTNAAKEASSKVVARYPSTDISELSSCGTNEQKREADSSSDL